MSRADRVVLSYPADLSDWSRDQLETRWFKAYLRKTMGPATVGREFEEFVDVGCCGSAHDVPLRVEAVDGGPEVAPDTEIEYTTREACGVRSGWLAQSAAGPSR